MNLKFPKIQNFFSSLDKSTWNVARFGDVAIQQKESVNRENTDLERYVAGDHMDTNDLHIRRYGEFDGSYVGPAFHRKFESGDILYGSRRTYLRKVAVADFDGITANTTFVIKANKELIEPRLLPFIMLSENFAQHSIQNSKGSTNPYINWKDIAWYEFRLPPMEMQKKLAELLWTVDETEEVILNNIKIIGDIFQLSLGEISSKNTADKRLGGLIELNYGKGLKESNRTEGKFSVVSSSGISGKHDKFLVEGPGIVVGRKGSAGEITWVENNFWPIDTAYWVSLKDIENTDLRFVYYLLQSLNLSRLSISTAIPGLNRDDALESSVSIPTLENQIKIREKLDLILGGKQEMLHRFDSTRNLRQSLINSIF